MIELSVKLGFSVFISVQPLVAKILSEIFLLFSRHLFNYNIILFIFNKYIPACSA